MIICNDILMSSTYVLAYTKRYFVHVDTLDEVRKALRSEGIYAGRGKRLSEITSSEIESKDRYYVLVQFSLEENYTEHEYRLMLVQKKYVKRFVKMLKEVGIPAECNVA